MAKKKDDQPELTADQLLEARVDAMMDPRPATPPAKPAGSESEALQKPIEPTANDDLPALDIFADSKGAPAVPKDLLKTIKAKPAEPVKTTVPEPETEQQPSEPPIETEQPATPQEDNSEATEPNLDDPTSDAAIDDIIAQEGDEVLAAEDAGVAQASVASPEVVEEQPAGKKRHTFFWFMVVLLVVVAGICAVVLTDPNIHNPFG